MKQILAPLALALCSFALCCGVAEVVLRLRGYEGDRERQAVAFGSYYGDVARDSWMFHPDFLKGRDGSIRVGPDWIPLEKPEGERRILFIGDSGTAGAGIPNNLVFAGRIYGSNSRSINAGIGAMTNVDEFYLLRDKLLRLHPDVVVLVVFEGNDVPSNLMSTSTRAPFARLKRYSALLHYVSLHMKALEAVTFPGAPVDEDGCNFRNYMHGEIATYRKEESAITRAAWDMFDDILRELRELGDANHFKLVVTWIPTASTLTGALAFPKYPNYRQLAERCLPPPDQLDFDKPVRQMAQIAAKYADAVVDPVPAMRPHGLAVFGPRDDHLSILGHQIMAESLAGALCALN